MNILTVAFTTNEHYRKESIVLRESAKKWNVKLEVEDRRDGWGWNQSVRWKPAFLLERMRRLSGEFDGMLYVDVDSQFCRHPRWGDMEGADFGAHWFRRSRHDSIEILTGTLYLRRCDIVEEFLADWIKQTAGIEEHSSTPEQDSLRLSVGNFSHRLKVKDFGPEWVWVYDCFHGVYPGKSPIIEHYQASRMYRRIYP